MFISSDCGSTIVVALTPAATKAWGATDVVFIYRRGDLVKAYPGGPMLAARDVEQTTDRFSWLKGEPRYLQNGGGISFIVRNGKSTRLPFEEGGVVNEETYVNDRETPVERPARREPPREVMLGQGSSPSAPPAGRSPPPAYDQPRRPSNTPVMAEICGEHGCVKQLVQAAPTIRAEPGVGMICRSEGQGCGTNADCCGGNCSGTKCQ